MLILGSEIYDPVPIGIAGMFALLLSIIIFQLGRKGLYDLYKTTLFARTIAMLVIINLYAKTQNPFFLSMLGIVLIGFVLTLIGHFQKQKLI